MALEMDNMKNKLMEVLSSSLLGMALALGHNLKIFDAMAAVSSEDNPATALVIAEKAGLKERYVKEWLSCVACGGIIEMDEAGEHFWIKNEDVGVLAGPDLCPILPMLNMPLQIGFIEPRVEKCFQRNGPLGISVDDYPGIHEFIDSSARTMYKDHFIPDFIPLTGMSDRLKHGNLQVLDVCCGTGFHSILSAQNFPTSSFTAIDLSREAIDTANSRKDNLKLENVNFTVMDAKELPAEWTKRFDWVMMYDACHDQTRPDLSLKEIRRVLRDGGTFTMVDVNGTGNAFLDKQISPIGFTVQYAVSVFGCLPWGSNSPDALCLGQQWGQRRAVELLNSCGFTTVKVVPISFCEQLVLYVCDT